MASNGRILPHWLHTVGAVIDFGVIIRTGCSRCGSVFDVDMHAVAQARGRAYSLIDARPRCKRSTCRGETYFLAARRMDDELVTLISHDGDPVGIAGRRPLDFEPPDGSPPPSAAARAAAA